MCFSIITNSGDYQSNNLFYGVDVIFFHLVILFFPLQTSTNCEVTVLKMFSAVLQSPCTVIIAACYSIVDQSECKHLYNNLSNYTNNR